MEGSTERPWRIVWHVERDMQASLLSSTLNTAAAFVHLALGLPLLLLLPMQRYCDLLKVTRVLLLEIT